MTARTVMHLETGKYAWSSVVCVAGAFAPTEADYQRGFAKTYKQGTSHGKSMRDASTRGIR